MVHSLKIRPFDENDEAAVVRLWQEVFPDAPAWNQAADDIRRKLSVQRELFLVATSDQEVIATAMAGYDGHRGWVYYVAVLPEYRRKGVASALMQAVEGGLVQMGCSKLNLQVRSTNQEVVAFYRHLGYLTEERISMGKRLDAIE
jgi:ribosomal protein S18 acetylase RimI-like enzyme